MPNASQTLYKHTLLLGLASLWLSASAQQPSSTSEGVYTEQQAARGQVVYDVQCIACHGLDLGGNSNAPGLVGMGFLFLWEGKSLGEFYETLSREMPTDRPGQLPAQDYLDVVAYILQKNAYPPGGVELPTGVEALERIAISSPD